MISLGGFFAAHVRISLPPKMMLAIVNHLLCIYRTHHLTYLCTLLSLLLPPLYDHGVYDFQQYWSKHAVQALGNVDEVSDIIAHPKHVAQALLLFWLITAAPLVITCWLAAASYCIRLVS